MFTAELAARLLSRRQHALTGLCPPRPHHTGIGIAEFMSKVFNE